MSGLPAARALRARAPLKLNLMLHVVGRRDDGYHELESLFAFAAFGDRLAARAAPELSLRLTGPFAPALSAEPLADNLVLRAARALRQSAGCPELGASLTLDKQVPVAAGLGGGSSDAATALRLLNRLWRLDWPLDRLAPIAAALGADVAACLSARPQWATGVGDQLMAMRLRARVPTLVVNPGVPLPTPLVFRRHATLMAQGGRYTRSGPACASWPALLDAENDLTGAAVAERPIIGAVLEALAALPGTRLARMSGSGASCFALFDSPAALQAGAALLRHQQPTWWTVSTDVGLPFAIA